MDLRPLRLSKQRQQQAAELLNYQPFFVSDDLQTGVGYSWLFWPDPRVAPPLVFHRPQWSEVEWSNITMANQGLRAQYDSFIKKLACMYPGGSLLDVGCNNGYFPVRAELAGMHNCAGIDQGEHNGKTIQFLNGILGTHVQYHPRQYSPEARGSEPLPQKYDVVSASAILCHLPDPLHFLSYLASLAKEAVFIWGQVIDTEHFIVSYSHPHPDLSSFTRFPYHFNDNTRLSAGLLKHAMASLGFPHVTEIPKEDNWIPMPEPQTNTLEAELAQGSRHRSFVFSRAAS